MSMRKRKRDLAPSGSAGSSTAIELSDMDLIKKYGGSSPRVQVIPGTWRQIIRGRRSKCDSKEWTCPKPKCGWVNTPVRGLFFDVPRFFCGGCHKEMPTDYKFGFSLANVEMNGACPVGNIKCQFGSYCALFCASSGLEIGIRIAGTLLGMKLNNEGPVICMTTFLHKIKLKLNLPKEFNFRTRPPNLSLDIYTYMDILRSEGVKNHLKSWPKVCKMSSYKTVPDDFEKICETLANGTPLLTGIRTGKKFRELKPNEIYVPPNEDQIVEGKSNGAHAILLLGGGMTPKGIKYYDFLNSYSEDFCQLSKGRKDGIKGGFGKVIASSLLIDPIILPADIEGTSVVKGQMKHGISTKITNLKHQACEDTHRPTDECRQTDLACPRSQVLLSEAMLGASKREKIQLKMSPVPLPPLNTMLLAQQCNLLKVLCLPGLQDIVDIIKKFHGAKRLIRRRFSDTYVQNSHTISSGSPGSASAMLALASPSEQLVYLLCVVRLEFLSALPLMGDLLVYVACFGDSTFLKMLPPFKCVTAGPATSPISIPTDNMGEAAFDKANKITLDEAENRAMAKIKIGINGYGSFGRTIAKITLGTQDLELVAKPFVTMDEMTCFFRDKKIHGQWLQSDFKMKDPNTLIFGEKEVTLFRIKEGNEIPWNMTGAEYIVAAYFDEFGSDFYKKEQRRERRRPARVRGRRRQWPPPPSTRPESPQLLVAGQVYGSALGRRPSRIEAGWIQERRPSLVAAATAQVDGQLLRRVRPTVRSRLLLSNRAPGSLLRVTAPGSVARCCPCPAEHHRPSCRTLAHLSCCSCPTADQRRFSFASVDEKVIAEKVLGHEVEGDDQACHNSWKLSC